MRFFRRSIAAFIGCALVAVAARAQDAAPDPAELFKKLDANGDGKLTASEVGSERGRFFERLVRIGDKNQDGDLSQEEFVAASRDEPRPAGRPGANRPERPNFDAGQFFDRLDSNSDGKLKLDELPEQARERMKPLFDRLGKEEVTKEEFTQAAGRFAGAPGGAGQGGAQLFERLDTNKDGKITADEVPERAKPMVESMLRRVGKDSLTREDFARAMPGSGDGQGRPAGGAGLFQKLDANRDGRISKEELSKAVEKFDELDTNKDGQLDPREVFSAEGGDRRRSGEARPQAGRFEPGAILRRLDKNGDGKIQKDEAEGRIAENFDRLDANKDGAVDANEFGRRGPRGGADD